MTTEIIKEIKNAERSAEDKIKAAQQRAKEILLDAEEEASRVIKAAEEHELQISKKQLEAAEKEASIEADKKREQNNEVCQELKRKAAQKMEDAVNLVVERIVRINGNS